MTRGLSWLIYLHIKFIRLNLLSSSSSSSNYYHYYHLDDDDQYRTPHLLALACFTCIWLISGIISHIVILLTNSLTGFN